MGKVLKINSWDDLEDLAEALGIEEHIDYDDNVQGIYSNVTNSWAYGVQSATSVMLDDEGEIYFPNKVIDKNEEIGVVTFCEKIDTKLYMVTWRVFQTFSRTIYENTRLPRSN